jgi:hypothetical protein
MKPQDQLASLPSYDQCLVHRLLYYVYGAPIISDYDYDMLERQALHDLDLLAVAGHALELPGSDLEASYPEPLRQLSRKLLMRKD